MSLKTIFDELGAALSKDDPTVIFSGPADTDTTSRAHRLNWQPVTEKHAPPRRTGPEGAVLERQWRIMVEVWGKSLEDAETLSNAFLAIAHDVLSHYGYQPGDAEWNPGGVTASGSTCRIFFQLLTPVPRRRQPSRTIGDGTNGTVEIVPAFNLETAP